jgi:beta-mannosidase
MFESKWGGADNQPPRFYGAAIYDDILPAALAKLDPARPYLPSSPFGGSYSNSGGIGDQHTWDVWHGRGDWKFYIDSKARFSSEFGFASAPTLRTWRQMIPGNVELSCVSPSHEIARWHDKTAKGTETFIQFVELHYPHSGDIEQWLYYSQLNQRDALRCAIEHFRRSEFCKGALIWQLNDCWPVQSWALLDSSGAYKAAAFEVRRLYAPLLASLDQLEDSLRLWAILDNSVDAFSGPTAVEARCLTDGSLLGRWETRVDLAPGQRQVVLEVDLSRFHRASTIISATLDKSSTFRLLAEPRYTQFQRLPLVVTLAEDQLIIKSDAPIVDLHLWDEEGDLILLDDFVTLPAGGSITLRIKGHPSRLQARSLAGIHPLEFTNS